jgi:beta-lactamase regulating signal transducer with metallopeptidase domain
MAIDLSHIKDYLLTQSWQIAILVIVIAAVSSTLRNKSAHVRYLLWLIVLGKCLVPPLFTIPLAILPEEEISEPAPISTRAEMLVLEPQVPDMSAAKSVEMPLGPPKIPPMPIVKEGRPRITIHEWVGIGWIVGASVFLIFNILRALRAHIWLWRRRENCGVILKDCSLPMGLRISQMSGW